jgi:hypothetical protein
VVEANAFNEEVNNKETTDGITIEWEGLKAGCKLSITSGLTTAILLTEIISPKKIPILKLPTSSLGKQRNYQSLMTYRAMTTPSKTDYLKQV